MNHTTSRTKRFVIDIDKQIKKATLFVDHYMTSIVLVTNDSGDIMNKDPV